MLGGLVLAEFGGLVYVHIFPDEDSMVLFGLQRRLIQNCEENLFFRRYTL